MASEFVQASAQDIRKSSIIQLVLTAVFLGVVFWMFDGTNADYPPIWLIVFLMVATAVGALFSERVWLAGTPLDPADGAAHNNELALARFASQTVRKLVYTEIPLLLAVLSCFVFDYGGWPLLIAGIPGLAVQAWETWPHRRNTSIAAAIFDSQGAESGLVESFIDK